LSLGHISNGGALDFPFVRGVEDLLFLSDEDYDSTSPNLQALLEATN
jgi:hypothetical protein